MNFLEVMATMVKCPFCQFDNEDGALFCEQCKSDLGSVPQTPPPVPPPLVTTSKTGYTRSNLVRSPRNELVRGAIIQNVLFIAATLEAVMRCS